MKPPQYIGLDEARARAIAGEVGQAVSGWRREAGRLGLPEPQIGRMASAFEHADLEQAMGFGR